jgi:hypothetical protein
MIAPGSHPRAHRVNAAALTAVGGFGESETMRALWALCLAGCFEVAPEYVCQRDAQCVLDGKPGECAAGSCAFPSDCPSGFRYGPYSGARAGFCVSDDGGGAGGDLAGADLAGTDGPLPSHCTRPNIMVAVENLTATGSDVGEVLRFELPGFQQCASLQAVGALPPQPEAVAWVAPTVAVATRDGLYVIDPDTDALLWSSPNPGFGTSPLPFPVDVFPYVAADGMTSVAVAYGDTVPNVTDVYVYRSSFGGDHQQLHWTSAELGLSTVESMSGSPTEGHLLAVSLGGEQAAAVDVTAQPTPISDGILVSYPGGSELLHSLSALPVAGHLRMAWASEDSGTANRVRFATDGDPIGGPIICSSCPQIAHVVPDPLDSAAWYALCVDATGGTVTNTESVRRVTSGGCPKVFDGTTLPSRYRLARLGVAQ